MKIQEFRPPKCPHCKKWLVEVFENEYNTYVFDSASATYKTHKWKGEIEIFCPHCEAELYDVFPDGVCNHVPRSKSCVDSTSEEHITCEEKSIRVIRRADLRSTIYEQTQAKLIAHETETGPQIVTDSTQKPNHACSTTTKH